MVPLKRSYRRPVRRRDFSAKSHRAPLVSRRLSQAYHHQPSSPWRWWLRAGVLIFLLGLIVALLSSPFFTIDNVIINNVHFQPTEKRLKEIITEIMASRRWYLLPQSNLIFFSTKNAHQVLASEFYIDEVDFIKYWPNVLKINVAENVIVAVWQAEGVDFLMDRRGVLVQQLADETEDTTQLARVVEADSPRRTLGNQVADSRLVEFIDTTFTLWKKELPEVMPDYISVSQSSLPTIRVYMPEGWYVNMTAEAEVYSQIESLKRLLAERIKDDRSKLQYIDVRFGNRLYFKLK